MGLQQQAKLPPYSIEAEQSVLGGLMLENSMFDEVVLRVKVADFYREDHRLIFDSICKLATARKPFDFVTLSQHLQITGELEEAGGIAYLGTLANDTPSAANVLSYADIVSERAQLRQIISVGASVSEIGYRPGDANVTEIVDEVERMVFALRRSTNKAGGPVPYSELMERVASRIEANAKSGSHTTGLSTGLIDFDLKTSGLQDTDLVVLAGRPSMGKTAMAGSIADYVAMDVGKQTLVFSMEMSGEQWAMRSLANRSSIPLHDLRSGQLNDYQMDRMVTTDLTLRGAPIMVDETPALSPLELRARARRVAAKHPLGLIVVDYIQLMQVPGTKENRTNEVSEITRGLKALAKEIGVPVLALSQLSRAVEQRDNKRPRMSDLRDSGGIEQDADLVLFIYRDEVYHPESPAAGTAEIIIAKQRNGALGTVRTAFQGQFCRFSNLADDWSMEEAQEAPRATKRNGYGGAVQGRLVT